MKIGYSIADNGEVIRDHIVRYYTNQYYVPIYHNGNFFSGV